MPKIGITHRSIFLRQRRSDDMNDLARTCLHFIRASTLPEQLFFDHRVELTGFPISFQSLVVQFSVLLLMLCHYMLGWRLVFGIIYMLHFGLDIDTVVLFGSHLVVDSRWDGCLSRQCWLERWRRNIWGTEQMERGAHVLNLRILRLPGPVRTRLKRWQLQADSQPISIWSRRYDVTQALTV